MFLTHISQLVRTQEITDKIKILKIEKGSRRGEFYYGLGIVLDDHDMDLEEIRDQRVRSFLTDNADLIGEPQKKFLGNPYHHFFENSEVTQWMSKDIEWHDFGYAIRFEIGRSQEKFNSHDFRGEIMDTTKADGKACNKLLWWSSAKGGGSFESFKLVSEKLGLLEKYVTPWSLLTKLILLGHAEVREYSEGFLWAIVPTTFVEMDGEKGKYYLAGRQSPQTIEELSNCFGLKPTLDPSGIKQYFVRNIQKNSLNSLNIQLVENAALTRASFLPYFKQWQKSLAIDRYVSERTDGINFHRYDGNAFIPVERSHEKRLGFYKIITNNFTKHRFYDGEKWLEGSYCDLRFLDYRVKNPEKKILYSQKKQEAFIESKFKWPLMYERALTLASGLTAETKITDEGNRVLSYKNVSKDLIEKLCANLGLQIQYMN